MLGSTRSIHGVSQIPPFAKIICMSTQRWTAFSIGSILDGPLTLVLDSPAAASYSLWASTLEPGLAARRPQHTPHPPHQDGEREPGDRPEKKGCQWRVWPKRPYRQPERAQRDAAPSRARGVERGSLLTSSVPL